MNYSLTILEMAVVGIGLGLLLLDLWTPAERKKDLGCAAAVALGVVLVFSFTRFVAVDSAVTAFNGMFIQDALSLFFKRFFLVAAIVVLIMAVGFSGRIAAGISEYYALMVFALAGMMFAASANDFALLFVSVELITITFYVLTSFQRGRIASLEAGVKYLILGALSSAFLVFGIALVYGTTGAMNFNAVAKVAAQSSTNKTLLLGLLLVLSGLGFKIAAFPFQIWAPDVYQGSPVPTTAFLSVGSKAAGFVLLLRVVFVAAPEITAHWTKLLIIVSAVTILYGNLCAIPQRSLKRLMGYSSISNAGYLLLGVAALSRDGQSAVLYFLAGYLFTALAAFGVIALVTGGIEDDDIGVFAGLNRRSPFLAATLALAMVSLAGIPPLAGFFGKFLLLKSVIEQGATDHAFYWLAAVTVVGVVISLYYYFGVLRAIYWSKGPVDPTPISISRPNQVALSVCVAGMFFLGLFASPAMSAAARAVASLKAPGEKANIEVPPSTKLPRLLVFGNGHDNDQEVVAFRVVLPESRRPLGCVISKPEIIDSSGHSEDVSLIRYVTPSKEPSVGFIGHREAAYCLRLQVALEEKGVPGWLHRVRNCWRQGSLKPLREVTFGDAISITSEQILSSSLTATDVP